MDGIVLPEGTEVEVIVAGSAVAPSGNGSLAAFRAVLAHVPRATAEDVDALLREIRAGRQPASYRGLFDENTRP